MSLGLIIAVIGIVFKVLEILLKKRVNNDNESKGFVSTIIEAFEEQSDNKKEQLKLTQEKKTSTKIEIKRPTEQRLSQFSTRHQNYKQSSKKIDKDMISDESSPIFSIQDLSREQLVNNIIFNEILSKPKAKQR